MAGFTRRDYKEISAMLRSVHRTIINVPAMTADDAHNLITQQLADMFERDNPAFMRDRFLAYSEVADDE